MFCRYYTNSITFTDIHIQTLVPSGLRTKMMSGFQPETPPTSSAYIFYLIAVDPHAYVKSAIRTIGWSSYCHGHIKHWASAALLSIIPQFIIDKAATSN